MNGTTPMTCQGNLNRRDHLRFLGITDRMRRSYENAVAAFFEYVHALRGRLPHTMPAELALSTSTIYFKKVTVFLLQDGFSVDSSVSTRLPNST